MNSGPSRVYLARLAGIGVFDPIGDQVGRVRDVVVALRPLERPRVLGLVVDVLPGRPVFLPITRVTTFDAKAVIFNGKLNMRRFAQRPAETLAIAEMLDRRVGAEGVDYLLVDLAMEPMRTRDWEITKVAVRREKGSRRVRAETLVFDWEEVSGLEVPAEQQGAVQLITAFERMKPADLANVMHELPAKRRREVAAALDDERLADVLEELPEDDQVEILGSLDADRAADVLEAMGPDDAADLLGELPVEQRERLLELMEPEEAEPVRRLMEYADNTAGGLMTTEAVILPPDATVAEALAQIRNPDLNPALAAQVYVVRPPTETPTGRYLGTVHFQRLLRDPPSTMVGGIVDRALSPLRPTMPLAAVSGHLATYNLVSAAVVDEDGHMLGAVTIDDVLDHLLPDDWRESLMDDEEAADDSRSRP
ncbi:magnesium transporter MgtE N-terminal domain-containing protein [Actinocorallia sp. A-T 12471]|uniref:magnesium transporter MgtE N-terminal domain-containing protein n=1 Tax=Actinocorallia sp. A-T 12471 TaxID=3089813 RepID=UPI0029CEDBA2|nr:CBS domain-containing protein [Actinocorallia sp. A-T 12471]MDX6738794.1 CBS domain-containing protein [Actinocorallia sp. A-T 12471]